MKRVKYLIVFLIMLIVPCFINAKEINIYLFYGDGCPHCQAEEEYLEKYLKENPDVKLHKYEIWYNEENVKKYEKVHDILDNDEDGIPYLIIGKNVVVGYMEESTPEEITKTINYYKEVDYKDEVGIYLGVVKESETSSNTETKTITNSEKTLPIVGKKDVKNFPLLLSTIIIGLVDGFNPCAMWILIFLISMLLGMKNKKRMWALGITFLTSSALVYFLFLISWLNLSTFLNKIYAIRAIISFVAIIFGTISVIKFIYRKQDDGCEVVDSSRRKKIITYIKKIVKEKSFILALLGIIFLAASVNIIELLCSLGLPVMFTQILTINEVTNTSKIIYSLIYVFFFLIDDIIIFVIAMKTMEIKAISNKFGKYSHLIGGIIMLIIGTLILVKPEWLMFNF